MLLCRLKISESQKQTENLHHRPSLSLSQSRMNNTRRRIWIRCGTTNFHSIFLDVAQERLVILCRSVLDLIFEIRERLRLERIHVRPCSFFTQQLNRRLQTSSRTTRKEKRKEHRNRGQRILSPFSTKQLSKCLLHKHIGRNFRESMSQYIPPKTRRRKSQEHKSYEERNEKTKKERG